MDSRNLLPLQQYEPDIRDIQKELAIKDGQFDPQAMIDLMVETIPVEHHKFRTMLPESIVEFCKDYQKRMWAEKI